MELPPPCQFGTEGGRRKPTHDFLSLCSHSSTVHIQDPIPPSQGKASTKEEYNMEISSATKKSAPQPQPPPPAAPAGEEHVLPGGIGTYSISHMSYINNVHQRLMAVPIKPEGSMFTVANAHHQQQQHQSSSVAEKNHDEHSNCSSYTGSGFTLWEESVANNKKGKTGKENLVERSSSINIREAGGSNPMQWRPTTGERPTQSSAADINHRHSFSSQGSGQRSQSFMDMIISAKNGCLEDEESDDNVEELVIKKENYAPLKGEMRVAANGKTIDQKATPRSKHSATEQRRRSKINDRFQSLRGLIPHSEQKRDKASFLLEVIEYIQFLQEKVNKFEGSYQGLNNEPIKLMPWKNNRGPVEHLIDHNHVPRNIVSSPGLMFPTKFDEKNFTIESDGTPSKASDHHHQPGIIANSKIPFPISPNFFNSVQNSCFLPPQKRQSDAENIAPQLYNNSRICTSDGAVLSDKAKEKDLTVEAGRINISSIYSQGLLNTLTQALQSSGVDLSQANVSVQIELGKRGIGKPAVFTSNLPAPASNQGITGTRMASDHEDSDQFTKKLKTGQS